MIRQLKIGVVFLLLLEVFLQGCIHEYPHPVAGGSPGGGQDPSIREGYIDLVYAISWEQLIHSVEFSDATKATYGRPYELVIEILKDGKVTEREVEYLSDEAFISGLMHRKISVALDNSDYQIGVWIHKMDENGELPFNAESLDNIRLTNFSSTDADALMCAYASDYLYPEELNSLTQPLVKTLHLKHPGARFEIVATDVLQFIDNNKPALNQGDKFNVDIAVIGGAGSSFNVYSGRPLPISDTFHFKGRMRLPFADYQELKIAEGFVFCDNEEEIAAKLSVTNSALLTVSATGLFHFPVKRGFITTVRGNFLTNPINGVFRIDHIWEEEEIIIEI